MHLNRICNIDFKLMILCKNLSKYQVLNYGDRGRDFWVQVFSLESYSAGPLIVIILFALFRIFSKIRQGVKWENYFFQI
jgi:hypothetical protein